MLDRILDFLKVLLYLFMFIIYILVVPEGLNDELFENYSAKAPTLYIVLFLILSIFGYLIFFTKNEYDWDYFTSLGLKLIGGCFVLYFLFDFRDVKNRGSLAFIFILFPIFTQFYFLIWYHFVKDEHKI